MSECRKVDDDFRNSVISALVKENNNKLSSSGEMDVDKPLENKTSKGFVNNSIDDMLASVIENKNKRESIDSDTRKKVVEKVFRKDLMLELFKL